MALHSVQVRGISARGGTSNFQRLRVSDAKSLEFLDSQTTPVLANLVLLQRDSLLSDVHSAVTAEELLRLRHAPLLPSSTLFPLTLLDTALSKTSAASNGALVHKALHPPRIPKRQPQDRNRSSSSAATPADRSGISPPRGRSLFAAPRADPATQEAVVKAPVSVRPDQVAAPTQVVGWGGVCHCIGDNGRQ